jgi:hypothetical protein
MMGMDVDAQNTLLFLVVVIAALLLLQTIAVVALVFAMRRMSHQITSLMGSMEEATRNAGPVLRAAREMIVESKEKLVLVSQNLVEVSELTKQQVTRVDGVMSDVEDRLRLQVIRLDQLVSNTMARVEETTELVQNNIVKPVREVSAILSGVRTGLEFLLHRNRSRPDRPAPVQATQEEELFI